MLLLLFMPFIFVDIYIAAQTFQKHKTNLDSNDILTKLLELHQYHCGEAATCGSSEHVEPSEFVIPVPCCMPCSCLSPCVEQLNCCPVSVNGTLTEPTTTSGLDDIVQENETNKTDDGLIFDRKGVVSWKKTDENDEKDENETKLHKLDELRIANSTGLTTKDSKVLKFNDIYKAHEKCIRPQLLYRPNRHLDSQAYMMVVTCPHGFKDKLIIDKCNARMDDVELLDMIPVTSKLSGLTYKNKHCLMCNEKLQAKYIMEWTAEIVSYSAIRRSIFFPSLDSLMNTLKRIKTDFSNIHFMPGDESLTRTCKAYDIIFCNQTGLWDIYNESVEAVCLHGNQLPITGRINEGLFTFKNIGCLHCNTGSDLSKGTLSCGYWETESSAASSFSLTLNLRKIIPESKKDKPVPAPYIDHDVLQQLQHRRCPAGKVNLLGRCRGIICPRDHYVVDNQCVPLYDTVKGLDLNIQIEITPSQTIPDDISEVFVDNIKQITDKALSDVVRLERRQVSLWYLPRSNANSKEYYLLNVFLFSQSNVIKYSATVEQIKQFFFKLKTGVKLAILEPLNIKLNIKFKHGLELTRRKYEDLSNGQPLKPLMENGWTMKYPGPIITISEVNWCFRAVFDLSEIDYTRFYILVQSTTDNIVFRDQFDRQENQFFVCIDIFIKPTPVKEEPQIIRVEKSSNGDKDKSGETDGDSQREIDGLIVIATLIAVLLLLVILFKVKNAIARKEPEELTTRSNQPPPEFVELSIINNAE